MELGLRVLVLVLPASSACGNNTESSFCPPTHPTLQSTVSRDLAVGSASLGPLLCLLALQDPAIAAYFRDPAFPEAAVWEGLQQDGVT